MQQDFDKSQQLHTFGDKLHNTKVGCLCVCNKDRCEMQHDRSCTPETKKKISDISSGVSGQMFRQSGESVTEENNTQVIQIFSHTSKYPRQFNSN